MAAVVQRRQIRRPNGPSGIAAPKTSTSCNSSRSGSPHTGSFIPQPKSAVVTRDRTANSDRSRPSSTASSSSISHLPVKNAGVPVRQQPPAQSNGPGNGHLIPKGSHIASSAHHNGVANHNAANHHASNGTSNNNSMLDKFKFFNSKDKSQDKSKVPKRPSSGGGFSSARSERSDSSVSLCGDAGSPNGSASGSEAAGQAKTSDSAVVCNGGSSNGPLGAIPGNDVVPDHGAGGHSKAGASSAAKGLAKKTFGRTAGKQQQPGASLAKVSTSHAGSSETVRSGLPRSSPSSETLNRTATRRSNANGSGHPRPLSSGHEIASSHVIHEKFPSPKAQESKPVPNGTSAPEDKKHQEMEMNSTAQTNNVGSGIPKPTAAVKGTTKQSREDLTSIGLAQPEKVKNETKRNGSVPTSPASDEIAAQKKHDVVDVNEASKSSPLEGDGDCQKQQEQITTTTAPSSSDGNGCVRTETLPKSDRSKKTQAQSVSIAMVSPIMSSQHSFSKDSVTASSTESSLSTVISVKEDKASSVIAATTNQNQQIQDNREGNQDVLVNGGLSRTGHHSEDNVPQQGVGGGQTGPAVHVGDQVQVNVNGEATGTSNGLVGGVESTVKSVPAETKLVPRANSVDSSCGKEGEEMEEALANIPPMQPLPRASPYGSGYSRGLSGHRAARLPACLRLQADVQRVAKNMLAASQDIARLYGAQRPTASVALHHPAYHHQQQQQLQQQQHADYAELSAGYVSDGDVLRAPRACSTEESSGYVSEGGIASLYAVTSPCRRPARYAIRDPKLINVLQDDSNDSTTTLVATSTNQLYSPRNCFDDSSSISSGLSDTFAELSTNDNLTDSSLSSDPYGCLKRRPHHPGMAPSGTSSGACNKGVPDRSGRKSSDHHSSASGSAVVGGGGMLPTSIRSRNANVKKTDSSMQTDSSALMQQGAVPPHLQSSANWKKYIQQQDLQHQQSKTNSTESLKSKESKRSGGQSSSKSGGKTAADSNRHEAVHSKAGGKSRTGSSSSGSGETKLRSYSADTAMIGSDLALDKIRGSSAGMGTPVRSSGIEYASTAVVVTNRKLPGRPPNVSGSGPPSACMMGPGKRPSSTASSGSGRSGGSSQGKKDGSAELDQQCRTSSLTRTGELPRGSSRSSLERKVKVSGSTQTGPGVNDMFVSAHSDSEYCSLGRSSGKHAKQYIQTAFGPTGSPALGTMRERIYGTRTLLNGSPPSYASNSDYVLLSGFQHGTAPLRDRPRLSVPSAKGSESDNYMTLDHSSPYAWLRHSPTSGSASVASAPVGRSPFAAGAGIAEADSMESLSSTASSAHGQAASRYMYLSSPLHSAASMGTRNSMSMSHYAGGLVSKMANKDDDAHGSSLSLVSTNSSLYSTTEEKQAHEIRKLRKQLDQANEKVATLTSQLTTNAHMVAAFEQSLSNMTSRLQHLTVTAEQKDSELTELRSTIEALKKQSAEAGLTKMALQSMAAVQRSMAPANGAPPGGGGGGGSTNLVRRHTFNTPKDAAAGALQDQHMSRQLSADSMSSVNSASSACSNASTRHEECSKNKHKKKKGWLRSSFSKAFSRSKKNRHGSVSDVEDIRALHSDSSTPNSPLLGLGSPPSLVATNGLPHSPPGCGAENGELSHSSYALNEHDEEDGGPELVRELRKQLREKDLVLTDIRLEALSSAHQLDNLKETLAKMRNEMHSLKQDNDRLHRLVRSQSLSASQSSLPHRTSMDMLDKRLSAHEISSALDLHDGINGSVPEGKRVTVTVHLVCHGDVEKCLTKCEAPEEALIGSLYVSGKTKWDNLDSAVKKAFKDYVLKVDPASNLGLSSESILCYHIDDIVRSKEAELPELLPCGYLVGETLKIQVVLRGTAQNAVDALALQTLIPKSVVQRYVSLLTEHRRIILCGPSGTGKTFLAQKLAEYLVLRSGRDLAAGSIATFSVDHKSAKELRQYLSNVAEQCENSNASDLPAVIILDNLHHVGSLGEVFNGFLSAKYQKCPYIIGTMNQATCSTTNLQLHHNFRWVLCANHMEPVKGFLGRFLRRRLVEEEVSTGLRLAELAKVVDWMPRIWHQLNQFLETHSSSDVTIGPRLFLACPMDVAGSQVWFTDLWNYSIVPYLLEAVREGLQLYGRRAAWEDPAEWVLETYPWPGPVSEAPQLLRLRPEDVGYDPSAGPKVVPDQSDSDADPLLNMLMRLQEAASYSSPQTNDPESADLEAASAS